MCFDYLAVALPDACPTSAMHHVALNFEMFLRDTEKMILRVRNLGSLS